ncbi:transglycosylase SLT domain-containing protein [Exiguobacterium antarcticum]|uniref:Transglycosylase SLT domain-containing protein n=1 Tax=Exiguobacterium antarcticum TaxID=132920 RepID=A0ABT6QZR8_9BACL|nr:transglycosylase SLT domain-containing protein [Exiguobacterium antarcticum]MDI3234173.1 transglycosylase SLT domain-containing protein [Exiguobacterium antarcticum]
MASPRVYEIAFHLAGQVNSSMRAAFSSAHRQISRLEEKTEDARDKMAKMSVTTLKAVSAVSAITNALGGVSAITAPVIAGVGAVGASFAAAGVGAAAYGVVATAALQKVFDAADEVKKAEDKIASADTAEARKKAQQELAAVYADMSKAQVGALKNLQSFKKYWKGFVVSLEEPIFQGFATSLSIAKKGLELLKPTIRNVSGAVNGLLKDMQTNLGSKEMKNIFNWISESAAGSLVALMKTIGHTTQGLFSLLQAFTPITASVESGMVGAARGFSQWAASLSKSDGFKTFIEYAKQNTPTFLSLLGNLGGILGGVIKQVAPLGPAVLTGLDALTGLISKALNAGIAIRSFGQVIQAMVTGSTGQFDSLRSRVTTVLQNIAPTFRTLGQQATNAFRSIATVATQAFMTLYTFWQNNGPMIVAAASNVFKTVGAVISGVIGVVRTILTVLKPIFVQIGTFIMSIARQIMSFWATDGAQIVQAVQNVFAGISKIIQFLAPVIVPILQMLWSTISGLIQGALNVIIGAVKFFAGLFTGDFAKMWEGVKQLFFGSIQFIWNYLNLMLVGRVLAGIKTLAIGMVKNTAMMWTSIKTFFTNMVSSASNLWTSMSQYFSLGISNLKWLVKDMALKIVSYVANAAIGFIRYFKGMWTEGLSMFRSIHAFGVSRFQALKDTIVNLMKGMNLLVSSAFSFMVNAVLSVVGKLKDLVVQRFLTLKSAVTSTASQLWNSVKSYFLSGANTAYTYASNLVIKAIQIFRNLKSNAVNTIMQLWNSVKSYFLSGANTAYTYASGLVTKALRIFGNLKTNTVNTIMQLWNSVKSYFLSGANTAYTYASGLVTKALRIFGSLKTNATNTVLQLWSSIKSAFSSGVTTAQNFVTNMGSKIASGFRSAKDSAVAIARSMWGGVKKIFDDIVTGARALPGKMGEGIRNMASKALSGITSLGNKLLRGMGKIVNGVIKGLNWALGKIGVDISLEQWAVPQYARGTKGHPGGPAILGDGRGTNAGPELYRTPSGFVGMSPARDTLMNLPKGTQVINARDTRMLMERYNIPAYKNGTVTDALKTAGSYVKEKATTAKDYVVGKAESAKNVAFDVFDYMSDPSKLLSKALEHLGVTMPELPKNLSAIASGAFSLIKKHATTYLKGKLPDLSASSLGAAFNGQGAAMAKKAISQALMMTNKPLSLLGPMMTIAQKESGFNPNAINDWDINAQRGDPSVGLFQVINSTFQRWKYPGHNNRRNPLDSALAAIRYMDGRYGGIMNHPGIRSMMGGGAYLPYKNGGIINRPHMGLVGEAGPEAIIPLSPSKRGRAAHLMTTIGSRLGMTKERTVNPLRSLFSADSSHTSNSSSASSAQFVYSPVYHIKGNVDEEMLRRIDEEKEADLEAKFMRWLRQHESDRNRTRFA